MDIKFSCANCGHHIAVDESGVGATIQCPNCAVSLTVPGLPSFLRDLKPNAVRLAQEKPMCWEHLLFFHVWADEIDKRANLMRENEANLSLDQREHVDKHAASQWFGAMADEMAGMVRAHDKLLNVSAPQSFGPPGTAGDAESIIRVATMLGSIFESMLQWVHRIRWTDIDEPFTKAGVELAKMPTLLIERVRRFPGESLRKLESAIAVREKSDASVKLDLTLDVGVVDTSACMAALREAERKLTWSPGINDRVRGFDNKRAVGASDRRQQREEQKRQRELEHRAKEQAKLSAIDQARLEVETYENRLEMLLSVHRQQGEIWNWHAIVAALAPVCPQRLSDHEFRARQQSAILAVADLHPGQNEDRVATIEQARSRDEEEFQNALQTYSEEKAEWEKMKSLARGILVGEHKAYIEALVDLNPFGEIADLGTSIQFTVHNARLLECLIKVNGQQAIPSDVKSLTATGKVSIKTMPKARFHEIYQDYVCGCVLRVAREVFALLPVETVLVTASADTLDPRTGQTVEQPVLSAAIPRTVAARLDFDRLDPSEAIENFLHRGDFKASRKSGAFESVATLTPADLPQGSLGGTDFRDTVANVRRLRDELRSEIERLTPRPNAAELSVKESV